MEKEMIYSKELGIIYIDKMSFAEIEELMMKQLIAGDEIDTTRMYK